MALIETGEDYTKTGKGRLSRWANNLTNYIPGLGGFLALPFGVVDTVIESAQWLVRGKVGSAITALAAGAVGNTVNALTASVGSLGQGITWWLGNGAANIATGANLGTHARALTETVIGGVTGALGAKPQVLQSYTAGIGSLNAGMAPQGPGKFTSYVSAQRGENADQAYARYQSGEGGVHINELQSAYGRGA